VPIAMSTPFGYIRALLTRRFASPAAPGPWRPQQVLPRSPCRGPSLPSTMRSIHFLTRAFNLLLTFSESENAIVLS
jgi:hypothetical protein